ncbi:hypothetical protein CLAIMM_03639 [Cladophialophora immunda]|nr:hypothetical protein CLAIMM_03639 [Cladophialophora immunda]
MASSTTNVVSEVWKRGIFENRVVFCTGGNGSICSVQVQALVYLGADACVVGRNVKKTELVAQRIASCRPGCKVLGIGGVDVRKVESLTNAVERCVKELGSLDFLIAGAAGNFLSPLHKLSPNAFKSVIDIDVLGSYNITKLALPHLVSSVQQNNSYSSTPAGRIIYVSATLHYTGIPLQAHASVAKAGIDALSSSVAIECYPNHVRKPLPSLSYYEFLSKLK